MVFGSITLTASVDHHTNEGLSMIDEGDDCAYVIGNNVRHSGQFQKFCIKFLFLILLPNFNYNRSWVQNTMHCSTSNAIHGKKQSDLNASNLF